MKWALKDILSEIEKGKVPSLILVHGDDLQVHEASANLLSILVREGERDFNLERFDGRSTEWDQIEAVLRTPPLLGEAKTVWVEKAPYFLSRERKGEMIDKVQQLWTEDKKDDAGLLLLDILALEDWTPPAGESGGPALSRPGRKPSAQRRAPEWLAELEDILAYCLSRGMDPAKHRSSQDHRLLELLDEGLPHWIVLLISTPHVDKRSRLYRRVEQQGAVLDLSLERERSGRIKREALADFIDRRIRAIGKRLEPKAKTLLMARAGDELWGVQLELDKLILYVGDQPWIRAADVEAVYPDRAEAWVFDLTASISNRNALQAMTTLARLLSQGEPALKLLGTVAGDVRKLLAARQLIEGELRGRWKAGMTFPNFQRTVLPNGASVISQNPYADYMSFQRAENFTSGELVRFLRMIHQTDIRLKSTSTHPRMLMERLILEMCHGSADRNAHS